MTYKKGAEDAPTAEDLVGTQINGFLKRFPLCPIGGAYRIGTMTVRPVCSKGESEGHALY